MTEPPPRRPDFRELTWLSPTSAEALLACRLRLAFKLDPSFASLRRPTPAALLGQVSHAVSEAASRGEFGDNPDEARSAAGARWHELVREAESSLAQAWGREVPPADRWAGYHLSRVRAIRRVGEDSQRRSGPTPTGGGTVSLEHELRDENLSLVGRPDRVITTDAGTTIVDLKSGWTQPQEIRPHQRRQLLLYAHLWRAVHGELPVSVAVQTADGTRMTIPVDVNEVDELVGEMVALREAYNLAVVDGNDNALAAPTEDNCRFCDFRPACGPYQQSVRDEWYWALTRAGWVVDVNEGPAGFSFDLDVVRPTSQAGTDVRIARVPRRLLPDVGDFCVVVDAEPTASAAQLRVRWNTFIQS